MGDKSQLTFEERQMTEAQRRQLAIGKAEREDQARREAEKKALDIRAQNPEDFKKELRRKYGNMFRAWKNGTGELLQPTRGQASAMGVGRKVDRTMVGKRK